MARKKQKKGTRTAWYRKPREKALKKGAHREGEKQPKKPRHRKDD